MAQTGAAGRAQCAWHPRKGRRILLLCSVYLLGAPGASLADGVPSSVRNDFGNVGLVEMPSARMAPDGEISFGASFLQNTQHYNFGMQVTPWLEGSFHYTGLQHFDPQYKNYYDRSYAIKLRLWDESDFFPAVSVGVNDLVGNGLYSSEYFVASKAFGDLDASLGIGWGRLGTTAQFGNPLSQISTSRNNRAVYPSAVTGSENFNAFFHGPSSSLFGGIIWHTPISGLSLAAEYSSDAYILEKARGNFTPRNQINYAANYQFNDSFTLGLGWLYGRSISAHFSFLLNPEKQHGPTLDPPPVSVKIRRPQEQQAALLTLLQQDGKSGAANFSSIAQSTRVAQKNAFVDALWQSNTAIEDVSVSGNTLMLRTVGTDALKTCRLVARNLQPYASGFDAIVVQGRTTARCAALTTPLPLAITDRPRVIGQATDTFTIDASIGPPIDTSQAALAIRADAHAQLLTIEAMSLTDSVALVYYRNDHFFSEQNAIERLTRVLMADAPANIEKFRLVSMVAGVPEQEFDVLRSPQERNLLQSQPIDLTESIAAPLQNPVLAMDGAENYRRFSWEIFPRLRQGLFDPANPFAAQLSAGAAGTVEVLRGLSFSAEAETSLYDNFNTTRSGNSTLPHVRSDFLKYFAQGKTGIGDLEGDYRFRLAPDVFAIAKAGYLENMFAGTGSEVLWRPQGQRWALGVDAYAVWQRNFDRLFGLQNYHVFTGHVSLYYASPWHELNFMVSAGQYLAGDRGITLQITRRFTSGVEIGAFATKTNISAAHFGESGFDEGIIIRIPLGWIAPIETQRLLDMDIRSVQRDGGQRLEKDAILYDETLHTSLGNITE